MDTWMKQLSLQRGMYNGLAGMATVSQGLRHATEMETAIHQVTKLLGTTPEAARARIERVRSLYPVLTVSEARRRVLRDHLYSRCNESVADWATRELARPSSKADHHTVYILGKPYHWRQDYTGQRKLAAGESPW